MINHMFKKMLWSAVLLLMATFLYAANVYAAPDFTSGLTVSSGNVGIGTTNPGAKLTVEGSLYAGGVGHEDSAFSVRGILGKSIIANYRDQQGENAFKVEGNIANNNLFIKLGDIDDSNNSTKFILDQGASKFIFDSGNVGIGTTAPTQKLDVAGGAKFLNWAYGLTPGSSNLNALATVEYVNSTVSGGGYWNINGTNIYNNNSGNVGIGVSAPLSKLHISEATGTVSSGSQGSLIIDHENNGGASSIVFRSKVNRGSDYGFIQYQDAATVGAAGESARLILGISNDTDDHIILQTPGNVGIGTMTPTQKLDVSGGVIKQSGYFVGDNSTDNMVFNGDFEMGGTYGWSGISSVTTGGFSGNYTAEIAGSVTILSDDYIPVDPTRDIFQLEAWVKKSVVGTTPGGLYFGYIAYDANKGVITSSPCGTYCYFAAASYTIPTDGKWHKVSATTVGEGTTYPNFPVGTKYVRVMGLVNYSGSSDSKTQLDHVTLKRITKGPLIAGNNFSSTNLADQNQYSTLYTTNTNNLVIDSANNVGIGTATPTQKLDVAGGAKFLNWAYGLTPGSSNLNALATVEYVNSTVSGGGYWNINGTNIYNNNSGNVGIGTTDPGDKLEVNGDLGIMTSGKLNFGSQLQNPSYIKAVWNDNNNTGLEFHTFYGAVDIPALTLSRTGGAVGIGNSSPTQKLDVNGNIKTSGHILQSNIISRPLASWSVSGNSTGAVVISLPGSVGTNHGMVHMQIDVYEYESTRAATTFICGGHNWSNAWYNYSCSTIGTSDKKIRLGLKNGKYVVVIGEAGSTWSYGHVVLSKITNGEYYSYSLDLSGAYSITLDNTAESYTWISPDLNQLNVRKATFKDWVGVGGNSNNFPNDSFSIANSSGTYAPYGSERTGHNFTSTYLSADKYALVNYGMLESSLSNSSFWAPNGNHIYNTNSGNVGIGTTTPIQKLHVQGAVGTNGDDSATLFTSYNTSAAGSPQQLNIKHNYGTVEIRNERGNIGFTAGNIGIGTTDPQDKLDVYDATLAQIRLSVPGYRFKIAGNNQNFFIRNSDDTNLITANYAGNVGIGVPGATTPDAKLEVRGSSLNNAGLQHYRSVGGLDDNATTRTGVLKIKMPKTWTNTMMAVTIKGYDYSGIGAWEVTVGGYNYAPSPAWYSTSAEIKGTAPFRRVRLAHDGSTNVILLGDTSTVWNLPKVEVTDLITGYSSQTGWGSGWDFSFITSETGIAYVNEPPLNYYYNASGNLGLGTVAPASKLDVNGLIKMRTSSISAPEDVVTKGYLDSALSPMSPLWTANGSNIYNSNTGNVGIKTTSPSQALHVVGNIRTSGDILADGNHGLGLVGLYSSTRYQNVFAMGAAYRLAADGTTPGNLHGIAWTHTNVGGQSKAGLAHQALFMTNGITQTAIGTGIWTLGGYTQTGGNPNSFSGSVGIGVTAPLEMLDVQGNINIRGGDAVIRANANQDLIGAYSGWGPTTVFIAGYNVANQVSGPPYRTTDKVVIGGGSAQRVLVNLVSGDVGINTLSPGYKLDVNGTVGGASFNYNSDENLKTNIQTITNPIDKIMALRGVTFNWKEDNQPSVGFVAQEVETVFPELVSGPEGRRSVQYGNIVAPLVEAFKAQQQEIQDLKQRIEALEAAR